MKVTVVSRSGRELVKGGLHLPDSATVKDLQDAIYASRLGDVAKPIKRGHLKIIQIEGGCYFHPTNDLSPSCPEYTNPANFFFTLVRFFRRKYPGHVYTLAGIIYSGQIASWLE